jgi:hypothetical protein
VSQVGEQENESRRGTLRQFRGLHKQERTIEILRGDFAKFRGPLDLAEVQGDYSVNV